MLYVCMYVTQEHKSGCHVCCVLWLCDRLNKGRNMRPKKWSECMGFYCKNQIKLLQANIVVYDYEASQVPSGKYNY